MAVYKRNNMWYIDYFIRVNGKMERRREPVSSRKDVAEARLKEYRQVVKEGRDPRNNGKPDEPVIPGIIELGEKPEELTLEQFIPIFMELHGNNQSIRMRESYKTSLKHLLPVFGKTSLCRISKVYVQGYMANRKSEGSSNASVNREIAFLKSVLERAVDWEYLVRNFLHGIKFLKEAPIRERYLVKDELNRLKEFSPCYLQEIITFALATGMRKSEIFGLKWDDVIINERFGFGEITIVGKGGKRRNVRMNKTVYDLLMCKRKKNKKGYVFFSPKTGNKFVDLGNSFSTALKKAGITNFRFHDLRHTAASWMVQGGADIYSVQKILGHSHIKTTQRYAHQSPEYLQNQICILDEFFDSNNNNKDANMVKEFSEAV